jgi:tetratricopeptide (TPR) repeat protein
MASSARIDELRKKFDENPRRYFAPLANEYRKSGDPEQAVFICQEYLPQQPGHMSGHIVYGQALFELSRFEEARAVFETALSLDPENLIALRHLGDIARQAGDTRGAREWYQRVLEADPRNEEIAQVMLTLPDGTEASVEAVNPPPAGQTAAPMEPIHPAPQAAEPPPAQPDISVVERGQPIPAVPTTQAPSDEPPPIPTALPVSTWGEAPPPSADDELLDLEDFSVGGVGLSSLGAPPPAFEPVERPPAASSSTDESFTAFDSMTLAETSGTAPTDAPIELASDIELGLPNDGRTGTTFSEAQGERLADLETFGEKLRGAEDAEETTLEVENFFTDMASASEPLVETAPELPPIESHRVETPTAADDLIESHRMETPTVPFVPLESRRSEPSTPSGVEPPGYIELVTPPASVEPPAPTQQPPVSIPTVSPAAPSEEFVTETMAELYLEQGHPEAAVEIYQQLVAQRPDDMKLVDRLRSIEAMLRGESVSEPRDVEAAGARGPTIRQFLAALLRPFSGASAHAEPDSFAFVDTSPQSTPPPMVVLDLGVDEPSRPASVPHDIAVDAIAFESETPVVETPMASIDEDFGESAQGFESLDGLDIEAPDNVAAASAETLDASPQGRVIRRETPGSSATVTGSIDALFSGRGPSASDVEAADALSQAFGPDKAETPPAPLKGVPAHAASSELSLDHVFKSTQPRRQDADTIDFSFDQFFSDELGDTAPKSGTEPSANSGGAPGDDIAQFNNWLNGLKKT